MDQLNKQYYLGKCVTKVLKDATTKVSTCTKDIENSILFINKIGKVDKKEFLCTAYATAIHQNTHTEEGLKPLLISYETNLVKYTKNIPITQLIRALHLLMKQKLFRFGTNYYRQKDATSIVAPPATDWATRIFTFYEMTILQDLFGKHMRLDKIFADDIIGL